MLPPPELTTSHIYLTSQHTMHFDGAGIASDPRPIPYSRNTQHAYNDLNYQSSQSLPLYDAFGAPNSTSQSLPSLGSMYTDDPHLHSQPHLSYATSRSIVGSHGPMSTESNTPSPVPSTISISSHSSAASSGYFEGASRASMGMRPLDTNGLVFASEFSPSDRFQPPPISTAYASLTALDTAHQTLASSWHHGGGGRCLHGPSARLMRA